MATTQRAPKWSEEHGKKALEGHYYIKVGDKSPGHLFLSGAPRYWGTHPDFVYVPSPYRVAGSRANLSGLFRELGYSEADINRILASGYTSQNYQSTMKASFDDEVAQLETYKGGVVKKAPAITLAELAAGQITFHGEKPARKPRAKAVTTGGPGGAGAPAEASSSPGRGGARGPKVSIRERLDALAPGKVLDLSNMKDDGTNIKTMDAPGPKSKKLQPVANLRMVSSVADRWVRAIQLLGPGYEQYLNAYPGAEAVAVAAVAPAVAPAAVHAPVVTVPRPPSPRAVAPGPGVPVVPTVQPVPRATTPKGALPAVPKLAPFPTIRPKSPARQ